MNPSTPLAAPPAYTEPTHRMSTNHAVDSSLSTTTPLHTSGVSWAAIIAGAAAAAALSLIMLVLGMGLGMSSVSPWADQGVSAGTFGVSTIMWITFTQIAASGMGGYLAGRLRTRWLSVHTDEVYFRDTAHGFLAWAVATLITAAMLTSAIGTIVGGAAKAGATVATGTVAAAGTAAGAAAKDASTSSDSMGMGYAVDSLFRKDAATPAPATTPGDTSPAMSSGEVTRIFANDLRTGTLSPDDTKYVGQLVAQRTGLAQPEAEKRATDTFTKVQTQLKDAETAARDAADKARKASAYAALWIFVSLLAGAFVASLAATYGGRRRDA